MTRLTVASGAPAVRFYNHRLFVELCRSVDMIVPLVVVGCIFLVANAHTMLRGIDNFLLLRLSFQNVLLLTLLAFAWHYLFLFFGLYEVRAPRPFRSELPSVVAACTIGAAVTALFPLFSHSGAFGFDLALLFWPIATCTTVGVRYGLRRFAEHAHANRVRRVLIVGSGPLAHQLYRQVVSDPTSGYDLLGFVDSNPDVGFPEVRDRMVGTLDELDAILMYSVVDEVLIALPIKSHYGKIEHVIEACESAGVQSRYSADVFRARLARPRFEATAPYPTVALKVACDDHRLAIKRMIDTVGAGVGLLVLSPVLVAIALVVRLTSSGPVLYRQERYGLRKRRFHMLKFRTMVVDADALQAGLESRNEAQGPLFKISNDPRVTRVGRFLRKTSLDELPQLWNVLMGDMSLVGPRPLPPRDVSRFSEGWLMRRFSVTPGMTGLWQVSGRSCLDFQQCTALDLQYIDQWSLALDLKILLRTVPAVIRMVGAS